MSGPMALATVAAADSRRIPWRDRTMIQIASYVASLLARRKPAHIRAVLTAVRGNARPATVAEATRVHDDVVRLLPRARGMFGCLPRSLTSVLVLRMSGVWATWCVGVRRQPPFAAHAWIEAESQLIGETVDAKSIATLVRVASAREDEQRRA